MEVRGVETDDPTMVRIGIIVTCIRDVHNATRQSQRGALELLLGTEANRAGGAPHAGARNRSADYDRAEGLFLAVRYVQSMHAVIIRGSFVRKGVHI